MNVKYIGLGSGFNISDDNTNCYFVYKCELFIISSFKAPMTLKYD